MGNKQLVRQLTTARDSFCGAGTKQIKLRLNRLSRTCVIAKAFRIALEIEDCSTLGKKYHGKWSDTYYKKKEAHILELIEVFKKQNWIYGKHDSDAGFPKYIVYFELPGCAQISFHTELQTQIMSIPDYPKQWDGLRGSTLGKLEKAISEYLKDEK